MRPVCSYINVTAATAVVLSRASMKNAFSRFSSHRAHRPGKPHAASAPARHPRRHGRLRLRRRHLARLGQGRRRAPAHLRRGHGVLPEVLAGRKLDRLHRRVQRQPAGLRHQRRRRRAAAADVLQRRRPAASARRHRQPRPRLDAGRQEHPLPPAPPAVERPHARGTYIDAGRGRHGDAAGDSRGGRRRRIRPTGRSSSTRRSSASSAPGSAIAAAARRTSGSTTSRPTPPSRSRTTPTTDNQPMWIGDTIYFTSDRDDGERSTSARTTSKTKQTQQGHEPHRLRRPLAERRPHADRLRERRLHLPLRLRERQERSAFRSASTATSATRCRTSRTSRTNIERFVVSPTGARALFVARGDIFTVPAKEGEIRNLTQTPGVRERDAGVVAGRQVDRLPQRHATATSTRSTSAPPTAPATSGRSRTDAQGVALRAALVARLEDARVRRQGPRAARRRRRRAAR